MDDSDKVEKLVELCRARQKREITRDQFKEQFNSLTQLKVNLLCDEETKNMEKSMPKNVNSVRKNN